MKHVLIGVVLVLSATGAASQGVEQGADPSARQAPAPLARHLVMFTREGPNFAQLRDHMDEAREHQALYERLAGEGHTIAGGSFEGQPVLGMTVFSQGIDEARARELIAEDALPVLGIVAYEFRTLNVRMGAFGAPMQQPRQ